MHEPHAHPSEGLPSDILEEEHRVIERMLDVLTKLSAKLSQGETPPLWIFTEASEFVADFADACHHAKEEKRMFPMLEEAGMSRDEGPLSVMLSDHERGRAYNQAMRAAAQRLADGEESSRQQLIDAINGYVELLRMHIKKEDNALFPMANRLLTSAQQKRLLEEFDAVEREETGEGVHEKYLTLLERAEEQVAS